MIDNARWGQGRLACNETLLGLLAGVCPSVAGPSSNALLSQDNGASFSFLGEEPACSVIRRPIPRHFKFNVGVRYGYD